MLGDSERVNAGVTPATAMMTIPEFCQSNRISKAFFYKLHKAGKSQPICKVRARSLISSEAAAKWRRDLEQQAA